MEEGEASEEGVVGIEVEGSEEDVEGSEEGVVGGVEEGVVLRAHVEEGDEEGGGV